jgi:2-keto-3-deoxy-L-rhamnonate aldolase RhmA
MNGKTFRAALASGVPQFGLCIMYPCPGELERIAPDWDWLWIDGQHGEMGYEDLLAMVRACDAVGKPAFVRSPSHDTGRIGLALDTAAAGVIVPLVDTSEEARKLVHAAKFPPIGGRSYGGRRPVDLHGRLFSDKANEEVLLIVQIESPQAIENADAIAAVPGVDVLFLGPDDVMMRRGFSMDSPRSKNTLGSDMQAVVAACRKHGKFSLASGGTNADMIRFCVEAGFNMIVAGGDIRFLPEGSKKAAKEAREVVQQPR